jgi:hypothetical protein
MFILLVYIFGLTSGNLADIPILMTANLIMAGQDVERSNQPFLFDAVLFLDFGNIQGQTSRI